MCFPCLQRSWGRERRRCWRATPSKEWSSPVSSRRNKRNERAEKIMDAGPPGSLAARGNHVGASGFRNRCGGCGQGRRKAGPARELLPLPRRLVPCGRKRSGALVEFALLAAIFEDRSVAAGLAAHHAGGRREPRRKLVLPCPRCLYAVESSDAH